MSYARFTLIRIAFSAIAISFCWMTTTTAYAQSPMSKHGGHTGYRTAQKVGQQDEGGSPRQDSGDDKTWQPRHGGLLTIIPPLAFEVVYLPRQIRVYVYGPDYQPVTTRGIRGEVLWQLPKVAKGSHTLMRYVASSTSSQGQDYLVADMSPNYLEDDDRRTTVSLRNLPWPDGLKRAIARNSVLHRGRSHKWP